VSQSITAELLRGGVAICVRLTFDSRTSALPPSSGPKTNHMQVSVVEDHLDMWCDRYTAAQQQEREEEETLSKLILHLRYLSPV
jgi:hypothetical protein